MDTLLIISLLFNVWAIAAMAGVHWVLNYTDFSRSHLLMEIVMFPFTLVCFAVTIIRRIFVRDQD